jgi:hypothetical protein
VPLGSGVASYGRLRLLGAVPQAEAVTLACSACAIASTF